MNAFEYITTTLKDFAYNYKTISAELNEHGALVTIKCRITELENTQV